MGDYIPTMPEKTDLDEMLKYVEPWKTRMIYGDAKEYTLTITESLSVSPNTASVTISVLGADPKLWREEGELRLVGKWTSDASTISHTGSGLFYFDGLGGARLVGSPLTVIEGTEKKEQCEDLIELYEVRNLQRFVPNEGGLGRQHATPCVQGSCIRAGQIRWKCLSFRSIGWLNTRYP